MISCPFCHSQAAFALEGVFLFYSCSSCKSLFRSDIEHPIVSYTLEYYGDRGRKFNFPLYSFVKRTMYYKRWKKIKNYIEPHDYLLDVGCGHADWLEFLYKKKQIRAIGIELPGILEAYLANKKWLQLYTNSILTLNDYDGKMKGIFFLHSFEHMPNPVAVMEKSISLLAPEGFIYIAIPNIHSWQYKVFKKKWLHLDPLYHLHFVSYRWLHQFFNNHGLERVQIYHNQFSYSFAGWFFSLLNYISRYNSLWELLKRKFRVKYAGKYFFLVISLLLLFVPATLLFVLECIFKRGATIEMLYVKK